MKLSEVSIILFCATKHELVAVCRVLEGAPRPTLVDGRRAILGLLIDRVCLAVACGVGPQAADRMLGSVLSGTTPRLLINFGAAGAVGRMPVGTPTIPREVLAYTWPDLTQEGETIAYDIGPLADALPNARFTRAGSCPHDLREVAARDRLRESLKIDTTDWETYRLAAACRERGITFVALRCITDYADEAAPITYGRNVLTVLDNGAKQIRPLAEVAWASMVEGRGAADQVLP